MSQLDNIIQIIINRETKAVDRQGFGTLGILGEHRRFNDLSRIYTDMSGVGNDFKSTDKEYLAARDYFSQDPKPVNLVIMSSKLNDTSTITVTSAVAGTEYKVIINGTEFPYTPTGTPSPATIATALVGLINGGSEPVAANDNLDGTFDLNPDVAGTPYTLDVEGFLSIGTYSTVQPAADDLDAIVNYNDNFYGLVSVSRVKARQLEIAAWTLANEKICGFGSNETDMINQPDASDSTTLIAQLKAAANFRSFVVYHSSTDLYYPESALMGVVLTYTPGSYTANYKTLVGIPISTLTNTQINNVLDKNGNIYNEVGGVNIIRNGRYADNTYIDEIHFADWLKARSQESLYQLLVNSRKVPGSNEGINESINALSQVVQEGIDNNAIATDPAPVYDFKPWNELSTADKINRTLTDIKIIVYYTGAIEFIKPVEITIKI